MAGLPRGTIQA
ncbi:hypothetical protein GQ607_011289 [Colletotrichum asianum]|uniref:Uncharacterized protein n=1 Tax=Colletotrichum asianum TaxID=702518 RepID=A0A8H3W6J4_9PEZI|nr:hypothetical protein GQ607_011289 [Colletotrichum asianum]